VHFHIPCIVLQIHRDLHVTAVLRSDARFSKSTIATVHMCSEDGKMAPVSESKELVPFTASLCIEQTRYQLPCSRTLVSDAGRGDHDRLTVTKNEMVEIHFHMC
jgi:hypothetical protein